MPFGVGHVRGPMGELRIRQWRIISDSNPAALIDHPIAILFLLLAMFSSWRFAIAGARSMQIDRAATPTDEPSDTPPEGGDR